VISAGETVLLTASYTGANATIDHMVGSIGNGNHIAVSPSYTSFYVLTVDDGRGNLAYAWVTVWVNSLTIFGQMPSGSVVGNGSSTFSVWSYATGTLSYQWYLDGSPINGETDSTITTSTPGTYKLRVTSTLQGNTITEDSQPIFLNVNAVSISSQPTDAVITSNASHDFTVTASGSGTLSYQWFRNQLMISGATSATYTANSAGTYFVRVTSTLNGTTQIVDSQNATLQINSISFTTQPASAVVVNPATVTLEAAATGAGTITYQWYKDGVVISNATSTQYVTGVAGTYKVRATSSLGNSVVYADSSDATVALNSVAITSQPIGASITNSNSYDLSVTATGAGQISYQWFKDGSAISGATADTYTATTSATYMVRVSSTVSGSTTSVDSNDAVLDINSISIATQPQSGAINSGTRTFTVSATASGTLSYQWFKDGSSISGANGPSYAATVAGTYKVRLTSTKNGSSYSIDSADATLTINSVSITSQPTDAIILATDTNEFSVTATGAGVLSYQWSRGSSPISGANSRTYSTSTSGTYKVVVTSTIGGVSKYITSSSATLSINSVTFSAQPVGGYVTSGRSKNLTVTATSPIGATLSYQWYLGNSQISGATSYLYSASASGQYKVRVTAVGGGTTDIEDSDTVTVTVVDAPTTSSLTSAASTIAFGNSVTITPTFAGGTGVISPGDIAVTSGQGISVSPSSTTTYWLTVTNLAGTTATSATTVTVTTGTIAQSLNRSSTTRYSGSTAVTLANGKVLVFGSENYSVITDLYDPTTNSFTRVGDMHEGRAGAQGILLPSGKVLVMGGQYFTTTYAARQSAELFDPVTNTWSYTGSLNYARFDNFAILLNNGKVLVGGGSSGSNVELYNPATGIFSLAASMPTGRSRAAAALLPNGNVLVLGGEGSNAKTADIYNVASDSWSSLTPQMNYYHGGGQAIATLNDGRIVIAGGWNDLNTIGSSGMDIFDPSTNTFASVVQLPNFLFAAGIAGQKLSDGRVAFFGGSDGQGNIYSEVMVYDPATNKVTIQANTMSMYRYNMATALLQDGRVFIVGGNYWDSTTADIFTE